MSNLAETLQDSFSDGLDLDNKWTRNDTSVVWEDGKVKIPFSSSSTPLLETQDAFVLGGSYFFADLSGLEDLGSGNFYFMFRINVSNWVRFRFWWSTIGQPYFTLQRNLGGSIVYSTSIAYDSEAHRFARLSRDGNTVRFHTSPDGSSWTQVFAPTWNVVNAAGILLFFSSGNPGGERAVFLNAVNVVVPDTPPGEDAEIPVPTSSSQAFFLIPSIYTEREAGVQAPISGATAKSLVPNLFTQTQTFVFAPRTTAQGSALSPTVETVWSAFVASQAASAVASAVPPTTSTVRSPLVFSPVASSSASVLGPQVEATQTVPDAPADFSVTPQGAQALLVANYSVSGASGYRIRYRRRSRP